MPHSVEKVAVRHFFENYGVCLSHMLRAANPEKYENLWVFIRFDAPVVKAGIKLKGLPPLNNPALLIIWGMCQRMPFLFQAFFNGFALPCPA